ncbi:unnamed protein product [Protopolystoma xenopodis]|uniref:Uncharacterized protein n=1 Tax=Protopolystoma xenopodis TaxID=117903 RepID=A0A3S5AYP9_9PLAT|nr:unnamed protein product [Protopolystoma xenopodis]
MSGHHSPSCLGGSTLISSGSAGFTGSLIGLDVQAATPSVLALALSSTSGTSNTADAMQADLVAFAKATERFIGLLQEA